jgi:hypothetical protein
MRSINVQTTLDVVGHALLTVLAGREDPTRGAFNTPLLRLVREEAEEIAPGAWDAAIEQAESSDTADPKKLSEALQCGFREALREARR